ncbi:efflux RND transporter permease subunit [Fodinibius saliphilus]|uniref:efflux RND transporter permease subunit n=1 Tax=Fodinibius saliphilus TaxID=1920650 RepID=UPI001BB2176D|nr:efflux RND transporter permease subunit [Fodinibius saliphilus]
MATNTDMNNSQSTNSGIIAYMVQNPIAANLLMFILLGGGIWSMYTIQKEVSPQFQLDIVEVSVVYPGAAPSEVEQGILRPVEEAIRGVQGIKEVTSTANEGSGDVSIELISGTNRMKTFQDIDQAINRIRTFPDDIEEPEVRLQSNQQEVMSIGIYGDTDIWTLRKLAENMRDQLLNSNEITQVEIGNVPDYVTHVEIPSSNLRKYNIRLAEVADLIAESSEDIPAGAIETNAGEILLRLQERKKWAEEFEQIEIISSGTGASIMLGDIATITDGFEETGFHGTFNHKPTVDLQIYRVGTQSPLDIAESVRNILENAKSSFPPGVTYRIDSNSARDYRDRLSLLTENGFWAIIIVLFILALFLEYRLAFWVMMGMTISFIGGLLFLPLIGLSINMISMFGFLVVLGIVVDDAIVVGENIFEYRQKGMTFIEAAIAGTRDMSKPVAFAILTNIIAFIPLLFIPGTTGKYWWPLPAVVIVVLTVSLFEALFILPAHLAHSSKEESNFIAGKYLHRWQQAFSKRFNNFINTYYRRFLNTCLKYRYVTLSTAIALLVIIGGYGYSGHMGMVMMPEVAADEIESGVSLPVGTTPAQAEKVAKEISNSTQKMFDEHNLDRVAEGIKTNVRGQSFIDVEIVMKPPNERDMTAREVIELWRNEIGNIKGVDQISFEAERGPAGYLPDISVDLSHSDIEVLEKASQSFLENVEAFDATRDVNDNYNRGKTQYDFKLLPEGRQMGLTPSIVGEQLRNAFYGALAKRQLRGTNEIEVRVKLPYEQRKDLHELQKFVLQTPDGVEVPLKDVVKIEQGEAFTSINRRDGRRVVSVSMDAEPADAVGRILESLQKETLPQLKQSFPGITWSFEGSQAEMRESTQALWGGFAFAMIVIYGILAVAFSSYWQPLIVMGAIPFGIVGAVIGHILLGYNLSLVSLMGVIALSGVVLNDSLIMIDYANKKRPNQSAFEAISEAGLRRFRPIMLTTLTTFGGLTPIILETSGQAYHLIPMAISLGFGIIFATSIILVIVPCLYMILEDTISVLKST